MKLFLKTFSIMLLTFLLLCPGAFANPVTIENGSFEFSSGTEGFHPDYGTWYSGDITGWDYSGDGIYGIWAPTAWYTDDVPDGDSIGYLNEGSIRQTTNHLIEANNVFTLSLDIGNRSDPGVGFPEYSVNLMAGNTKLDWDGEPVLFPDPGEGLFSTLTLSYTVLEGDLNIGGLLGIEIVSGGRQLNFDNVVLNNDAIANHAVPEPATMLLLGTGLLGLAGYGRKKKFFKK